MIGHLYRYPHPTEPGKFLYVGQGLKRDSIHRRGATSFGRRFKKLFPDIELPQPTREIVEVENQLELNELETIWMFQYHTWHGYEGGMNLRFPEDFDYREAMTVEEHRANGLNAVKNGTGIHSSEYDRSKGGKVTKKRRSGIFSPDYDRTKGGRAAAVVNVASGQLDKARNSPKRIAALLTASKEKRLGIYGIPKEKKRRIGLSAVANKTGIFAENFDKSAAGGLGAHNRFHVTGKSSPRCSFCSEQNLIVAYA